MRSSMLNAEAAATLFSVPMQSILTTSEKKSTLFSSFSQFNHNSFRSNELPVQLRGTHQRHVVAVSNDARYCTLRCSPRWGKRRERTGASLSSRRRIVGQASV